MTGTRADVVLRHIRALTVIESANHLSDRQLLDRFAAAHEEIAFAALVRRHGPLVLGVCRRVLHQEQDAEDVFQATFLTLARKADSAGRRASLGTWLYHVAYHLALKVRKQSAARQKREERTARREKTDSLAEVSGRELVTVFDEELQTLPASERLALVLCYLQSKTRDEAAREVGCSTSTLKRRLERGKERLRLRLSRRGVVLSAALLAAGLAQGSPALVPTSLTVNTVKAGLLAFNGKAVTGLVSAQAAALAAGAVRATVGAKLKAVGALLFLVALLAIGAGPFASSAPPAAAKTEPKKPAPVTEPKAVEEKEEMALSGRVLDDKRKPLAGAEVAVLGWGKPDLRGGALSSREAELLGRTKTDEEGRFQLKVPRKWSDRFVGIAAMARVSDHGVGWQLITSETDKLTAEIHLAREQIIRGRFVDVQGQPAAGVTLRVESITVGDAEGIGQMPAGKEPACWPKAVVTDKDGRFELRGIGREAMARLQVDDARFARQDIAVPPGPRPEDAKDIVRTLEPAHVLEGTITYADTGKPVPGARLAVYAGQSEVSSMFGIDGRADDKGRFRINPTPGNYFHISAYAPDGQPYLTVQKQLTWPKAAIKQTVDLSLPRGVLVRGTVTAADKPVAKATVQFIPRQADNPNFRNDVLTGWQNSVVSGADGRFDICVLPGPGHLLIHGPTSDFIYEEIGDAMLSQGKKGGRRYYAHAIVKLDLKRDARTHDPTATLKPAVTVKGKVVGPDGKPVAEALMVSRLHVEPLVSFWRGFPLMVRDGRFELHGCEADKTYSVSFLDTKTDSGATVELTGKQTGEDVTVRLAPCGKATIRLLDADGKPIAKSQVSLEMVVTPGAAQYDFKKLYEKGEMAADSDFVANIDRANPRNVPEIPLTDADGRITFSRLIPGATYRIVDVGDQDDMIKCEFKAESGKTITLGDIVRKKQP
jgi:RNA polymerase sigma factor (sigma-70 family)